MIDQRNNDETAWCPKCLSKLAWEDDSVYHCDKCGKYVHMGSALTYQTMLKRKDKRDQANREMSEELKNNPLFRK